MFQQRNGLFYIGPPERLVRAGESNRFPSKGSLALLAGLRRIHTPMEAGALFGSVSVFGLRGHAAISFPAAGVSTSGRPPRIDWLRSASLSVIERIRAKPS